ncbi:MAG: DNA recombination protein RmuC [Beijerinckiaceae bacterium]|nr:DNA recombination protein RmuC [Beijerinckiaceae bacterium]
MPDVLFTLAGVQIAFREAAAGAAALAFVLLCAILIAMLRMMKARRLEAFTANERQREIGERMADLARMNAEVSGRLRAVSEVVADRLDAVGARVGSGLEQSARTTADQLARLGERLAVIDRAQANLSALSQEMVSLKHILSNKQTRGAYGQGRMEAIVRDGLPVGAFAFQTTLSNGARPDCIVKLPGDDRPMIVDAKFPLESFTAFREARDDDQRRKAAARVRADVGRHVRDIQTKYLLAGETQDTALLFVPSEAVYADLQEHFEDMTQKASAARVLVVSPSLLMLAIQVMQAIVRDARMREQAHVIQAEVRRLLEDVERLRERTGRLGSHLRQANDDMENVGASVQKIVRRGDRILQLEFDDPHNSAGNAGAKSAAPSTSAAVANDR